MVTSRSRRRSSCSVSWASLASASSAARRLRGRSVRSAKATVRWAALLDEQDRDPRSRMLASASKSVSTTVGASPSDGSSRSSRSGPREQRPRDRQLLLLAAGEKVRRPRGGEVAHDREQLVHPLEIGGHVAAVPAGRRGRACRFSSTVSRGEDVAALGDERDARCGRSSSGAAPRSERPASRISPRCAGTTPMIESSVVDLPAPLGPISPTISPRPTSRSRSADGRDRPVADLEALDLEQGLAGPLTHAASGSFTPPSPR